MINYDWLKTTSAFGLTISRKDKINYYKIMGKSKIEWTDRTWNPTVGCSKVSQGCKNCYAMVMSSRIANAAYAKQQRGKEPTDIEKAYMGTVKWESTGPEDSDIKAVPKWSGEIGLIEERVRTPLSIQKPQKIFVDSMTDLFHPDIPIEFIDKLFATMILATGHTFQILTKRPDIMEKYIDRIRDAELGGEIDRRVFDPWRGVYGEKLNERPPWPIRNIWLGTSIENQEVAEERIPDLLKCDAYVRFLSCEPLLGPVDLFNITDPDLGAPYRIDCLNGYVHNNEHTKIDWVIAGGESGPKARPMHPEWARSVRDQCKKADVAFFFKQWGRFEPWQKADTETDEYYKCAEHGHVCSVPDMDKKEGLEKMITTDFDVAYMLPKGKNNVGHKLDGETHLEFPE